MRINNPEILYRYRPLGNSWANTLVEITGMLWFSKSEGLNDPFDGLGYSFKYDRIRRYQNDIVRGKWIWSVACFTTKWDNPTMWAHYANDYSGICLGYDRNKIENHIKEIAKNVNNPRYTIKDVFLKPMTYENDIPQTFKSEEEPLTVKTNHWEYEDEWRLGILSSYGNVNIKNNGTPCYFKNALSEIIYTEKLKTNELIAIKKIVKESNLDIKFYKISIEKGMRVMKRDLA